MSEVKGDPGGEDPTDELTESVGALSIGGTPPTEKEALLLLVRGLHGRFLLYQRVHTAVVRDHTEEGFLVDMIVYDTSEQPPLEPQSTEHETLIPAADHPKEGPRHVLPATMPWNSFPNSLSAVPIDLRVSSSAQYFPDNSIVNVGQLLTVSVPKETHHCSLGLLLVGRQG